MKYHVLGKKKMIRKHITECSEKWSEYYTCKQREVEVNQKGHLTKHQYTTMSEPKKGPWPELQMS